MTDTKRTTLSIPQEVRDQEELQLYAAYEADAERQVGARGIQDMTLRGGVV